MMHFEKSNKPTPSLKGDSSPDSGEPDIKEYRKKLRNRESAQRARDRQKERMRWLEGEVRLLTIKNQTLQSENEALRNLLEDKVNEIRRQQQILSTTRTHRPFESTVNMTGKATSSPEETRSKINIPGRIQGTISILNSEKEKIHGPVERVAVISPMTRTKEKLTRQRSSSPRRASPYTKDTVNHFDAEHGKVKRQLSNEDTLSKTNPSQADDVTKRLKYSKPGKEFSNPHDLGMQIDPQLMPLAAQFMRSPYAGYLPSMYPTPYGSNMAFVNFLPNPTLSTRDEKSPHDENMQKTMSLLRDANTLSLLRAQSYFANTQGTLPTLLPDEHMGLPLSRDHWNPLTMTVNNEVEKSYQSDGKNSVEPKPMLKPNLQRFKMNSFDSECSSTQTSESELPLQSP